MLERLEAALTEDPGVLLCIVGQTASGKTNLASRLAACVGGEVITADSVQIYRELDAASGKPTAEELALAPHHLVSALDPLSHVDAARFVGLADAIISDVRDRGRIPIVCGGTYLWVKALVWGLAPTPAASPELRERHRALATEHGRAALHEQLRKVDPPSAARLHPNDLVRVSRALEVFESTGRRMSDIQAEHGFTEERHRAKLFAIRRDPEDLRARIERRVDAFLREGLVDEVRSLVARGRGGARGMGAVGYKEAAAHLRGELRLEELPQAIVRSTRVFARRQRTWLTHEPVTWLEPCER
jgi:tRNA dimethylallyltransferase